MSLSAYIHLQTDSRRCVSRTVSHAPADAVASAATLNEIEMPGGVARVTQQLMEARRRDKDAVVARGQRGHYRRGSHA